MSNGRMLTGEELSRFDDISGPALYSAEVKRIERIPQDQQWQYVERARNGCEESRDQLLLTCLNWTMSKAHAVYYDREPSHTDVMDLVGHANIKMVEALPHALDCTDPVRYLMSVAAMEMNSYCTRYDPMVRRPKRDPYAHHHPETVSAEAGEFPLIDLLKAPDITLVSDETRERQHDVEAAVVFNALCQLTEKRRAVLIAAHGLFGQVAQDNHEIAQSMGIPLKTVYSRLRRARLSLAEKLAPYMQKKVAKAGRLAIGGVGEAA